jgi:putative hydrolase of the HAD superfamily
MPEKRLVIFDLDNTLVVNRPATKKAYASAIRYIAKESKLEFEKLHNHWKRIVQKVQVQSDPEKRAFDYSLGLLLTEHRIADVLITPALKMYEKELLAELRPIPGAKEVLSWLKESKAIIAVAAGVDRTLAKKKLKATDLFKYVDLIISASEVGVMKPHPDYFNLCMAEFKVKASQTLVISDSKTEDLAPAEKLNLKTIKIESTNPQLTALKPELAEFLSFAK